MNTNFDLRLSLTEILSLVATNGALIARAILSNCGLVVFCSGIP